MGTAPLGLKACRRIATDVGEPIKRAVGSGGYTFGFVTFDHRHGWWSKRDRSWGWHDEVPGLGSVHWSSCRWLFRDGPHVEESVRREVPEHLCGATTVLDHDSGAWYPVICNRLADEPHKWHECGSLAWPNRRQP